MNSRNELVGVAQAGKHFILSTENLAENETNTHYDYSKEINAQNPEPKGSGSGDDTKKTLYPNLWTFHAG